MDTFSALGFHWDRAAVPVEIPTHSVERVAFRFHRMLPDFVWDACALEGNPFTFTEVKTLLDGVTVGGRRISEQQQVLSLAESSKYLLKQVKKSTFALDRATLTSIHDLGACKQTSDLSRTPAGDAPGWHEAFEQGVAVLRRDVPHPFEQAAAYFLFGAQQRFFPGGNKSTSGFMMNGILMSAGMDAISVPAARALECNEALERFYLSKDATEMMDFLLGCHPEAKQIREANSAQLAERNDKG